MEAEAEPTTTTTDDFQLRLPVFEGPLDLLLYLVVKEQLDITEVALVQVTDQYLTYLRGGDQIDADALAEFIAIGARLIYLKSKALLPRPPAPGDEDEDDVAGDLIRRLQEYRRFKEAAGHLREREEEGVRAYPRLAPPPEMPLPTGLDGVTLQLLAEIVQEVLQRQPEEGEDEEVVIEREPVSLEQKVADLNVALQRRGRVSFRTFISASRSREEVVVAFLAVLELIKMLRASAEQDSLFGDIQIVALQPEAVG